MPKRKIQRLAGTNCALVSPLPIFRLLLVFVFVPGLESLEGRLLCAHSFPISAREQLQPLNNWQENTQDSTRSSTNRPNQSGEKGEEQEQVKKKADGKPWRAARGAGDATLAHLIRVPMLNQLSFELIDSLSREHPEMALFLLKEMIIRGALEADSVQFAVRLSYQASLSNARLPTGLEAIMLRNLSEFGTTHNPMSGVQAPNQVDLIGLVNALMNLFRASGKK